MSLLCENVLQGRDSVLYSIHSDQDPKYSDQDPKYSDQEKLKNLIWLINFRLPHLTKYLHFDLF
jgi:hypothetical protein